MKKKLTSFQIFLLTFFFLLIGLLISNFKFKERFFPSISQDLSCYFNDEICDNGIDDDCDGKIDCYDEECSAIPGRCCPSGSACWSGCPSDYCTCCTSYRWGKMESRCYANQHNCSLQIIGDYYPLILKKGWNSIGLPVNISHPAESFLQDLLEKGANCTEISRWADGSWDTHFQNNPFNDFSLELGKGYYLHCEYDKIIQLTGDFVFSIQIPLYPGWNYISIPLYEIPFSTNEEMLQAINSQGGDCQQINIWVNEADQWKTHTLGSSANISNVKRGEGYMVFCNKESTFIPEIGIIVSTTLTTTIPTETTTTSPCPSGGIYQCSTYGCQCIHSECKYVETSYCYYYGHNECVYGPGWFCVFVPGDNINSCANVGQRCTPPTTTTVCLNYERCTNELDDDCDGKIDCYDEDCSSDPTSGCCPIGDMCRMGCPEYCVCCNDFCYPNGYSCVTTTTLETSTTVQTTTTIYYELLQPTTTTLESGGGGGGGIIHPIKTTTSTTIPCNYECQSMCIDDNESPNCFRRINRGTDGCPGGTICCETIKIDCPKPPSAGFSTIISRTTTTIFVYQQCPYECCVGMEGYLTKYCPLGFRCSGNSCISENPPTPEIKMPLIWIIVTLLFPLVILLILLLRSRKPPLY